MESKHVLQRTYTVEIQGRTISDRERTKHGGKVIQKELLKRGKHYSPYDNVFMEENRDFWVN